MKNRPKYPFKRATQGEKPSLNRSDIMRMTLNRSSPNSRYWIKPATPNLFDIAVKESTVVEPRIRSRIKMPDWAISILKERDASVETLLDEIERRLVSRRSKNDYYEADMILTELSRTEEGSEAIKKWMTPDLFRRVLQRKKIRRRR